MRALYDREVIDTSAAKFSCINLIRSIRVLECIAGRKQFAKLKRFKISYLNLVIAAAAQFNIRYFG